MHAGISCAVRLTQGHMTKEADLDDEDRTDGGIFISDEWVDGWCEATDDTDPRTAWRHSRSGVRWTCSVCPQLHPHTIRDPLCCCFITMQRKMLTGSMNVNEDLRVMGKAFS